MYLPYLAYLLSSSRPRRSKSDLSSAHHAACVTHSMHIVSASAVPALHISQHEHRHISADRIARTGDENSIFVHIARSPKARRINPLTKATQTHDTSHHIALYSRIQRKRYISARPSLEVLHQCIAIRTILIPIVKECRRQALDHGGN